MRPERTRSETRSYKRMPNVNIPPETEKIGMYISGEEKKTTSQEK